MDPLAQFQEWFKEAQGCASIAEPTAMTLATAAPDGSPAARIVLLKSCDARGFLFYTNLTSRKSLELEENPRVALCFYWMPLGKQVRVEGHAIAGEDQEADAYFASRPRARQIGAWASLQSQPMTQREELERRVHDIEQRYRGKDIPRPPHWSGWRVVPHAIEFWQQSEARLHERHLFQRNANGTWEKTLLYP